MVAVIGEALIDLVQQKATLPASFIAHCGGSPLNVAIGLARLDQPTQLFARLSTDGFGRQLSAYAASNGIDLSAAVAAEQASTLAVVGLDDSGGATYDFYVEGTADWQWTATELAALTPAAGWVHAGSLASWIDPGGAVIYDSLHALAGRAVISFDPNVRPNLMPDHAAAIRRIEALVALADVVKASVEDIGWLYPIVPVAEVLARWAHCGPSLVVITEGSAGATAMRPDGQAFSVAGRTVAVVDTVGAGDSFMAGLINAILRTGAHPSELTQQQAAAAIAESVLVSALTCQRAGADPPTAAELARAR